MGKKYVGSVCHRFLLQDWALRVGNPRCDWLVCSCCGDYHTHNGDVEWWSGKNVVARFSTCSSFPSYRYSINLWMVDSETYLFFWKCSAIHPIRCAWNVPAPIVCLCVCVCVCVRSRVCVCMWASMWKSLVQQEEEDDGSKCRPPTASFGNFHPKTEQKAPQPHCVSGGQAQVSNGNFHPHHTPRAPTVRALCHFHGARRWRVHFFSDASQLRCQTQFHIAPLFGPVARHFAARHSLCEQWSWQGPHSMKEKCFLFSMW